MKTPEPKFLLKEPKGKEQTLISMVMRFNNQRLFYSTGEHVCPNDWDFKNQRVKSSKRIVGASDINHVLDKLEQKAKELFRNYKAEGKFISASLLKKELDDAFNNKVRNENTTLLGFIKQFIEENKGVKKDGTVKAYGTTLNHLQNFKKKRLIDVEFETIDMNFYNRFRDYLYTDLNLSLNTVGKQIKNLKTFLSSATQRGINKNLAYKDRSFKKLAEEIKHIYLTTDEIDTLYKLNLKVMPNWEVVRDIFVIGCYTGLRFQDLTSISERNIKRDGDREILEFITNKTGERVVIPLSKTVKEIVRKYNYQLPKAICNQKFNAYLKFIGERAGLTDIVETVKTVGGSKQTFVFKKFELITTHTARRSFATNAFLDSMPTGMIMRMTGHKTEQVFRSYINVSQEENANAAAGNKFFSR